MLEALVRARAIEGECELALTFVDETTMAELNKEFLGEDGPTDVLAFPIDDENGTPWLIQGVMFDITERKNAEEQVAFLAYHDKLTGLPNRALFEEMLENAIARARRSDGAVAPHPSKRKAAGRQPARMAGKSPR